METHTTVDPTQEILGKVAHVRNVAHKGKIVKPAVRFSTLSERQAMEKEHREIDEVLNAPTWAKTNITTREKEELYTRRDNLDTQLEELRPPQLDGKAKDALQARLVNLNEQIQVGMLSEEEMWRNPAGAVDRHRKWEARNKDKILERRNILIALEPDSDSVEGTSIEMIRPTLAWRGQAATFMADAQLPGHFAQTPQSKANFEKVFPESPTIDTPLKQLERQEAKSEGKRAYHRNQGRTETEGE